MALRHACSALLMLFVLIGGCGAPPSLSDAPLTEAPSVDGSLAEWEGRLMPLDNPSVSMAALPTDSLLYVAVLVRDQRLVRTIADRGLIVWVDPAGGTNRTYGIQYPLGLQRQQAGRPPSRPSKNPIDAVSLDELEVLRGDTLRTRIPARFSSGLRAQATLSSGSLIYEAALPVGPTASPTHRIASSLGPTVGLGLETPSPEKSSTPTVDAPDLVSSDPTERRRPRSRQRDRQPPEPPQRNQNPTLNQWVTLTTTAP